MRVPFNRRPTRRAFLAGAALAGSAACLPAIPANIVGTSTPATGPAVWTPVAPKGILRATSGLFGRRTEMDISAAKQVGMSVMRWDLLWEVVENRPNGWVYGKYDELAALARANNIKFVFILGFGNQFYDGLLKVTSDAGRAGFVRFAEQMVNRYGDLAVAWQIWNEPNHPEGWEGGGDPDAYTALLKAVVPVLKKMQPDRPVIIGNLSQTDAAFARKMFAAGALEYGDIFGLHPYRPSSPDTILEEYTSLRSFVPAKFPVAFSEWGYSTYLPLGNDKPATFEQQASYYPRMLVLGHLLESPFTMLYDATDDGDNRYFAQHNYGMFTSSLQPKPVALTVKNLLTLLGDLKADRYLVRNGMLITRFRSESDTKTIIWPHSAGAAEVRLAAGTRYTLLHMDRGQVADDKPLRLTPTQIVVVEGDYESAGS